MKKTLLAIAALAATSGAFAQSSVTLYGVVDASVEHIASTTRVARVSSSNLASSRLGFKGSEDLGSGLRANFVLEAGLNVDTGANTGAAARFFDRSAWAGLQGGFGELRLGRIDSPIGALAGDTKVLGAQNYDDLKIAPTRAGNTYRRVDNAITYVLPEFVSGLTAQLQYSTAVDSVTAGNGNAETTPGSDVGKAYGLNVKYLAGPFSAGVGYLNAKDEVATAGKQKANAALAYAGYDFGVVKLTGYYNAESRPVALGAGDRLTVAGIKVGVPLSTSFLITASVAEASNVAAVPTNSDHDDAVISSVKATYSLSKRTTLYGLFTNVHNESSANLGISGGGVTVANGQSARGLAFGVAHAF